MPWNWELPDWPNFKCDLDQITEQERQFFLGVGGTFAFLKNLGDQDYHQFIVEILTLEGEESSKIEGEILDRESLQSSIKQHFGLQPPRRQETDKESRIAKLLCDVYESFAKPLTHEMLWEWHSDLFKDQSHLADRGMYRSHPEPMQIISNRYDSPKIFYQAPPSEKVPQEMDRFIAWFNDSQGSRSVLGRAAIAHVYFESIHPFEDGNGRIGRILVEKILSQGVGRPILIAVSKILKKRRKEYYSALESCNRTLEIQQLAQFFADVIVEGQEDSMKLLSFLIQKSKILTALSGQMNPRQEKVLVRMFAEGLEGFKGGLSAEKYIAITKTSRATATRDLIDLVQKGAFLKTGELRHTRYWLNLSKE